MSDVLLKIKRVYEAWIENVPISLKFIYFLNNQIRYWKYINSLQTLRIYRINFVNSAGKEGSYIGMTNRKIEIKDRIKEHTHKIKSDTAMTRLNIIKFP